MHGFRDRWEVGGKIRINCFAQLRKKTNLVPTVAQPIKKRGLAQTSLKFGPNFHYTWYQAVWYTLKVKDLKHNLGKLVAKRVSIFCTFCEKSKFSANGGVTNEDVG